MKTFDTPRPIRLVIRARAGEVTLRAADDAPGTTPGTTVVTLAARNDAAHEVLPQVVVEQSRDTIAVHVPRGRGGFLRPGPKIDIDVVCPAGSHLDVRAEAGDVTARGTWAHARCVTGSGDVDIEAVDDDAMFKTGSGAISAGRVARTLRASTGSGDINLDESGASSQLSVGSGQISIGQLTGDVVTKSGSGDVEVGVLGGSLVTKTGSGAVTVRRAASGTITASNASGDIVIGVVEGTAAWLDVSTQTGRVSQELGESVAPVDGQPTVEITARTVTGNLRVHRA